MSGQLKSTIGTILCRGIVPAWLATGAIVKLLEASPRLLPAKTVLSIAKELEIDLVFLLAALIAIEFVGVIVMVLLSRYARSVAIFFLSVFSLILIGEMVQGNITDCGCFGGFSPKPWAMLLIDGGLLLGVVFFKPSHKTATKTARWSIALAALLSLASIGLSFSVIINAGRAPEIQPAHPIGGSEGIGTPITDPTTNPNPKPLKGLWYTDKLEQWIDKPWRDLELFQFMPIWPSNMDEGKHYVVFYRRTCDHCEEMFYNDLIDPELAAMVTAIEIPEEKNLMRPRNRAWALPETECELLNLPLGCDWLIQSPLTIRVEDGIVTCATEGDHNQCMELGPADH